MTYEEAESLIREHIDYGGHAKVYALAAAIADATRDKSASDAQPVADEREHAYVLAALVAAGHVSQEKVDQAFDLARKYGYAAPRHDAQDDARDAARWRYLRGRFDDCSAELDFGRDDLPMGDCWVQVKQGCDQGKVLDAAIDAAIAKEPK